jgi:hypothetical protein
MAITTSHAFAAAHSKRIVPSGTISVNTLSFRATGIFTLQSGGRLTAAHHIAAHESRAPPPSTTAPADEVILDEIERIRI